MDLAGVVARIRAIDPFYPGMFSWLEKDGIVKAVPNRTLSGMAFNLVRREFRRLGGKYVSHDGRAWFELRLEQNGVRNCLQTSSESTSQNKDSAHDSSPSDSVLLQTEAQLIRLLRAARVCLMEGQFDG